MGDGRGRWGTVLHSDARGKFRERPDETTECRPSSSLILTCRATLENDRTGRQTAVRPRPGSGRTDCPVENTAPHRHRPHNLRRRRNYQSSTAGKIWNLIFIWREERSVPDRGIGIGAWSGIVEAAWKSWGQQDVCRHRKACLVFTLVNVTATAETKAEAERSICWRDGGGVGCCDGRQFPRKIPGIGLHVNFGFICLLALLRHYR